MSAPKTTTVTNGPTTVVTNDNGKKHGSPRFFGSADSQLFGVLYTPGKVSQGAVLVCHPIGHEYLRTHQLLTTFSSSLCMQGYSVLHFDYSGTGDSSGLGSEASLLKWQQDVQVAAQYLRARSGTQSINLCSLRMGALIMLSAKLRNVSSLTLLDPVLEGADWLAEQSRLQSQTKKNPHRFLWTHNQNESDEIFGYKFSDLLKKDLCELKAKSYLNYLPEKTQIIRSQSTESNKAFLEKLGSEGTILNGCITDLQEPFHWSTRGFSEQHLSVDLLSHSTIF